MKISIPQKKIFSIALAVWGTTLIGTGTSMAYIKNPVDPDSINIKVVQKRVANSKSNEIKLKDMESEVNKPISVNIKDFLERPEDIDEEIIKNLKLDTSMVNVNQAGSYTYTITYKKKKFSATFVIKEKELPNANITVKDLDLEVGSSLSTDIQTYVVEQLDEEVKKNTTIDLSAVNTAKSGNYQYRLTYKNRMYTGTINIYEPNSKPNSTEQKDKPKE